MVVKCDFCKKNIRYYAEYTNKCQCGKITCSDSCHEIQFVILNQGEDHQYANVCKDEILAHGERGYIRYHYSSYDGEGEAILKDPTYELMLKELEQLRKKVAQLSKEVISLQTQIDCAPGGTEYLSAKKRFDTQNY
jgi:hypothetical protein